ncbi:MAG TPA: NAD-dependent epimerase/dehydratase family protein [Chthonomonadaceae bacterium]|nr:NAD-dependent epimerase/dehydratase family protein [Chthonomonadaceae bacterium]
MRRVLVTGASGFIGRCCLGPLVARGYEVTAVSSRPARGGAVRWVQRDLLNVEAATALMAAERPDALLHLAWYAVPGRFWEAPDNFAWIRSSLALLRAFLRSGGRRIVTSGTCAEYAPSGVPCLEGRTPLQPTRTYGACKHAVHSMQAALCRQAGAGQAWGRVFHTYGPGEPPQKLVTSVIDSLLAGRPARCTHGRQVRDLMHVRDVGDALVALLDSDVQGPVNIASGRPVALGDVAKTIGEQLGRPDLVQLGAIESPPQDPPVLSADTARLRCEVGWLPMFDLEAGLRDTIGRRRMELEAEAVAA